MRNYENKLINKIIENGNACKSYGEPGYSDPEELILIANWNDYTQRQQNYLEHLGYALEYDDEFIVIEDKAYRTVGDCFDWRRSYAYDATGENEVTIHDSADTVISAFAIYDKGQPHDHLPHWITEQDLVSHCWALAEEYVSIRNLQHTIARKFDTGTEYLCTRWLDNNLQIWIKSKREG